MKHTFTIEAEYANGLYHVEILDTAEDGWPLAMPIGEGDGATLNLAIGEAFKNLDLPESMLSGRG